MLAFYVAYPSIHIFRVGYPALFIDFQETLHFFRVTLSPFYWKQSHSPKHIFQGAILNVVLESSPNVLEPQISLTLTPPPLLPQFHPAMTVFYFLNSLSLFSKYSRIYKYFLKIRIYPPFSE